MTTIPLGFQRIIYLGQPMLVSDELYHELRELELDAQRQADELVNAEIRWRRDHSIRRGVALPATLRQD